jgi:hypothetical protein
VVLGRISGGGSIEELNGTSVTTILDVFTSTLKGLVPASGGGSTNFLRADGVFAPFPGTGVDNLNTGSGFRLVKPASQEIKTLFNGYAVKMDSTTNGNGITFKVDTSLIATAYDLTLISSSKFGLEDVTATSNRNFDLDGNTLAISNGLFDFSNSDNFYWHNKGDSIIVDLWGADNGANQYASLTPSSFFGYSKIYSEAGKYINSETGSFGDKRLTGGQKINARFESEDYTTLTKSLLGINPFNIVGFADSVLLTTTDSSAYIEIASNFLKLKSGGTTSDTSTYKPLVVDANGISRRSTYWYGGGTTYTDEKAQDAIGAMINASLQYVDGIPLLAIGDRDNGDITVSGSGLVWSIDNGSVTNSMLAGSIAISKLSITGTPDGTKFLRDDGVWANTSGSGTVNSGTTGKAAYYVGSTTVDDFDAVDYATSGTNVKITPLNTTDVALLIQGISSLAAAYFQVKNSGGTKQLEFTENSELILGNVSDPGDYDFVSNKGVFVANVSNNDYALRISPGTSVANSIGIFNNQDLAWNMSSVRPLILTSSSGNTSIQAQGSTIAVFNQSGLKIKAGEVYNATPEALLEVEGTEGNAAVLILDADDGDDDADNWNFNSETGNNLTIKNHTTTVLTLSASAITAAFDVTVPDEVYDATAWNGSLEVPTKNAIRDKIESLAGGATTALDNLAAVAINTSLLPATDDAIDLGSASKQWRDLYLTGASIYMAGVKTLSTAGLDLPTGGGIRTRTTAANTVLLQAYDVDGAAYTTFGTLTANNTPTLNFSSAVTVGGDPILTTVAAAAAYQPLDGDLTYLAGFTPSANVKTILNAADYVAIKTALTLTVGTDVQAFDADLTTWAGITPTTVGQNIVTLTNPSAIRFIKINADNTVTARTAAEMLSDIGAQASGSYQPLDGDLTTLAGLTATTDNFIVSISSAWASRTPAQVKTTLALDNVTNESKATMFTNATFTGTFAVAAGSIANAALANGAVANLSGTNTGDQTTIAGITGTTAQFNTALTDNDFATLAGTETLSGKTLTAPRFATAGFIADNNGNELIIFTTTTSAVNEWTLANGATGVNPLLTASGETNVGLDFKVKGTGVYNFLSTTSGATDIRLFEDADNGNNYTSLISTANIGSNIVVTLPNASSTLPIFSQQITYTGPTAARTVTLPDADFTVAKNDGSNWTISGQAIGDIAIASSTTGYGKLAAVAAGSYLRSAGTGTAPVWSTLTLPNTIATGEMLVATGTNVVSAQNTRNNWTSHVVSGADFTTTSTSLVDITGLVTATLSTATTYEFECVLTVNSSSTAGMAVGVQQSGTGSGQTGVWSGTATNAAATGLAIGSNTLNTAGAACVLVNGDGTITIRGFIKTGSSGSPTISMKVLKTTSGTATVRIGSVLRYRVAN